MFLGYAANHAGNAYRVLNLKTNKVLITCDVRWLNTLDPSDEEEDIYHDINIDDEESKRMERAPEPQEEPEPPIQATEEIKRNKASNQPRMAPELRKLQAFNNPGRLEIEGKNANLCFFVPEIVEKDDTPTSFQEAWNHEDPTKCEKWRQAI